MLEVSPILFVAVTLASLLLGFGVGIGALIIVGQRLSRNLNDVCAAGNDQIKAFGESACGIMGRANAEAARQLGYLGEAMQGVIEIQHRQQAETYQRNAALVHMLVVGSGKHDRAVADLLLTGGAPSSLVFRPNQHVPPLTRRQEAEAARRTRQRQTFRGADVPGDQDSE